MSRRVYEIENELLDRLVAYQQANELHSEVEAVRRLLAYALDHRETFDVFEKRLRSDISTGAISFEQAVKRAAMHPHVTQIHKSTAGPMVNVVWDDGSSTEIRSASFSEAAR